MTKNNTPPGGPKKTLNHSTAPLELMLAGERWFPAKARILLLLSDQSVAMTYRDIATILGLDLTEVRRRGMELDRDGIVERKDGKLRLRWQGLPDVAEDAKGFVRLRKLTWDNKGHNTKPLKVFKAGADAKAMELLTLRFTDDEYEFLQSFGAFDELSLWTRDLPRDVTESGLLKACEPIARSYRMSARDAAICSVVEGALAYHLDPGKKPIGSIAKVLRFFAKNEGHWRDVAGRLTGGRDRWPTLAERLVVAEDEPEEIEPADDVEPEEPRDDLSADETDDRGEDVAPETSPPGDPLEDLLDWTPPTIAQAPNVIPEPSLGPAPERALDHHLQTIDERDRAEQRAPSPEDDDEYRIDFDAFNASLDAIEDGVRSDLRRRAEETEEAGEPESEPSAADGKLAAGAGDRDPFAEFL